MRSPFSSASTSVSNAPPPSPQSVLPPAWPVCALWQQFFQSWGHFHPPCHISVERVLRRHPTCNGLLQFRARRSPAASQQSSSIGQHCRSPGFVFFLVVFDSHLVSRGRLGSFHNPTAPQPAHSLRFFDIS